jgi:hypothetical protein
MTTAKTLSISTWNNTSKVVKVTGSILQALKNEGYPKAYITGPTFGSLGDGKGSFFVKEGI